MKKKYVKPMFKAYTIEIEDRCICASPNSYQQDLLDKHHNWYWDGD